MRPDENKRRHIVICGKSNGGSTSVEWDDILNKPEFATVATSGDYDDLTDKPTILTQWFGTQAEYDAIAEKDPNTVYNIEGSDNVQADWSQSDTTADDYIKNKPTIPAAQVNSDWNSASGVSQILNKPTIPSATSDLQNDSGFITINDVPAQVNADWNSNSGVSQILNKPAMTTETLTFTLQGGTTQTITVYTQPTI